MGLSQGQPRAVQPRVGRGGGPRTEGASAASKGKNDGGGLEEIGYESVLGLGPDGCELQR